MARFIISLILLLCLAATMHAVPVTGDRVQAFCMKDASGNTAEWKPGKVTVFSVCAFWCITWKDQCKRIGEMSNALTGLPVDFITVSYDGRWSDVAKDKLQGTLLLDAERLLARRMGINKVPYTMVVDERGIIRYAVQGIIRSQPVVDAVRGCFGYEEDDADKVVYLTFDDFPTPKEKSSNAPNGDMDAQLLDILRENGVCATFFCICERLQSSRDTISQAMEDGHSMGIHAWEHTNGKMDVSKCSKAITNLTGISPTLLRAPGNDVCRRLNGNSLKTPVVNPYDYKMPGKEEVKRRVLLAVKPGSVILLHSGVTDTIGALPDIISSLKGRRFRFEVLK